MAVIEPIEKVQSASESDRLHVGQTLWNWRQIQQAWRALEAGGEYSFEVDWPVLFVTLTNREVKQTLDIHLTARALDPSARSIDLSINHLIQIETFLQRYTPPDD